MAAPDPSQPASQLPYLTFPPFPEIPPGSLCAFKDFLPSGIQVPVDESNEIELDGLGIPTLELRVKHNTDESKTGKKRKKKSKKAADGEPIKRLTWWEEWEEGEDLRLVHAGFGSDVPRVDRLIKAAQDFADGRRWPPMMTGVRAFWDSYRLYLGLLANPNFPKTTKASQDEPADADISDDEDEPMQPMKQVVEEGDNPTQDEEGVAEIEELAEDRLVVFLTSPEKSTKVFLTQYMREHGLIWSEKNLIIAPRLLTFFFNFLLRNHILHESSSERGLRAALEVTELALKELPLTAKMGQALPDRLSMGLKEVFGRMASASFMPDGEAVAGGWGGCADEPDTEEEGPRKKAKVEEVEELKGGEAKVDEGQAEVDSKMANEFEAELKAANATIIRTDDLAPDVIKQIVEDNVGMDVDVNPGDTILTSEWGEEASEPAPSWGPAEADNNEVNPAWGDWGQTEESAAEWDNAWAPLQHSNLMEVLGPTTLPLTHDTGIVEKSTRRIKSIILPPPIAPSAVTAQAVEGEDSVAVEEDLEQRFARIVLQPWVGDKSPDAGTPIIRLSSKGAVYPGAQLEDGSIVEGDLPPPELKVHNPLMSEITLLVELNMVDILSVGMGLEATWIQLVKQEGKDGGAGGKKKKKSKGSKIPKGYWYMEELLMTFPSFYTHEKLAEPE